MDNAESHIDVLKNEVAAFNQVHMELNSDYVATYIMFMQEQTPYWMRMSIRAFFAHVEANVYGLKRIAYSLHIVKGRVLSDEEVAAALEYGFDVKENGEVVRRKQGVKTLRNVKLAFSIFSKASGIGWIPNYSDPGWESFRKSIDIRDRVTHPKSIGDITITSLDTNQVNLAQGWWRNNINLLFFKFNEKMKWPPKNT